MNKQNANSTLYNSEVSRQISKKRQKSLKEFGKEKKKSHRARDSAAFYRTWKIFDLYRGKKQMNTTNRSSKANR